MSLDLFSLTGRRALITGSSQGIGLALARGLAAAGAEIILNGRDESKLATAAAQIPAPPCRATTHTQMPPATDVHQSSQTQAVRRTIHRATADITVRYRNNPGKDGLRFATSAGDTNPPAMPIAATSGP